MTTKPLFSIVTITRNTLDGFMRTKASIELQSCNDYEWLVVDGLSTDGTQNALPENAISEADEGIYDAMNKGINRAKGEYILFLNAGDTLSDPDILSTLTKAISVDSPDFLYGDALETGGFYKKARHHRKITSCMFTHHQAMLYRRDKIGNLRYDDRYRIAGDYDFTRSFLKNAQQITYIPAALCIFETGGVSQRNMHLGRVEQYKARQKAGCGWIRNMAIYAGQSIAATIKSAMPGLYFCLKRRAGCPAIFARRDRSISLS